MLDRLGIDDGGGTTDAGLVAALPITTMVGMDSSTGWAMADCTATVSKPGSRALMSNLATGRAEYMQTFLNGNQLMLPV